RREGHAEHQYDDDRDGADDRRGDGDAGRDGSIPRDDRVPGSRHAAGDGHMGRSGRQGINEVLGSGPLTAMSTALRMWTLAVVAAVLPCAGGARAQAPTSAELTIDELVARAVADNPDLRAARAELDAAAGRLRQAGLRPNPELELGGQKALSPDNT